MLKRHGASLRCSYRNNSQETCYAHLGSEILYTKDSQSLPLGLQIDNASAGFSKRSEPVICPLNVLYLTQHGIDPTPSAR